MEANEVRYEEYRMDDADLVLIGYGIVSRVLKSAVDALRSDGKRVGLLRPITLFPFPSEVLADAASRAGDFLVVEMSNGQMLDDVRLAVADKLPVHFYNRMGGVVPTFEEVVSHINDNLFAKVSQ
jgi:pyruvate/2-oxoacid:ferredoxin oxidoreductase alpha subunit